MCICYNDVAASVDPIGLQTLWDPTPDFMGRRVSEWSVVRTVVQGAPAEVAYTHLVLKGYSYEGCPVTPPACTCRRTPIYHEYFAEQAVTLKSVVSMRTFREYADSIMLPLDPGPRSLPGMPSLSSAAAAEAAAAAGLSARAATGIGIALDILQLGAEVMERHYRSTHWTEWDEYLLTVMKERTLPVFREGNDVEGQSEEVQGDACPQSDGFYPEHHAPPQRDRVLRILPLTETIFDKSWESPTRRHNI